MPDESSPFLTLYRQFQYRSVDLELLSLQGDITKLLGQFAALLLFVGAGLALGTLSVGDPGVPADEVLRRAWRIEHTLIASTMLVTGIFAVLSWETTFPNLLDVMVLGTLPIKAGTIFAAKTSATASTLALAVLSINALSSVTLSMAMGPQSQSLLDWLISPERYRAFAAYWATMLAAGAFLYGAVLAMQTLAAALLPRRAFLRLSSVLQMSTFCGLILVYVLQPSFRSPTEFTAPENQMALQWLPSYWFLGLFQQLNGTLHPAMAPLAEKAWLALGSVLLVMTPAYVLTYFHTLRRIVEEPDIVASSNRVRWSVPWGHTLAGVIVEFSIRTILRSRQHRVTLAFFMGAGLAVMILFARTPRATEMMHGIAALPIFCSLVMMTAGIVGTRVVFGIPLALRANWVFRVSEVRSVAAYIAAVRYPLFAIAAVPIWLCAAAYFLMAWPWRMALGHLLVLGLWGMAVGMGSLAGFRKIPFTCSWLPGKGSMHMSILGAMAALWLLAAGAVFEHRALEDGAAYSVVVAFLAALGTAAWVRIRVSQDGELAVVQFEDEEEPALIGLGLHRDGVVPG